MAICTHTCNVGNTEANHAETWVKISVTARGAGAGHLFILKKKICEYVSQMSEFASRNKTPQKKLNCHGMHTCCTTAATIVPVIKSKRYPNIYSEVYLGTHTYTHTEHTTSSHPRAPHKKTTPDHPQPLTLVVESCTVHDTTPDFLQSFKR